MDAAETPRHGVVAVHVEGLPGPGGADADSIDYELSDANEHIVSAVQVKARVPGKPMGAGQVFKTLAGLVRDRDAARYELLTSAEAGDSARDLVSVLGAGLLPGELRAAIDTILAWVSAGQQRELLAGLADEHLTRLGRAGAEFDSRDDQRSAKASGCGCAVTATTRVPGSGDASAGLVIGRSRCRSSSRRPSRRRRSSARRQAAWPADFAGQRLPVALDRDLAFRNLGVCPMSAASAATAKASSSTPDSRAIVALVGTPRRNAATRRRKIAHASEHSHAAAHPRAAPYSTEWAGATFRKCGSTSPATD